MKPFCGLLLVLVVVHSSSCESLVRRKRFFNTLWPSEEVKSDINNGLIYSQLPPEYLYLLPGVHDHKMIQRRSGVQPAVTSQPPQTARFVHPTRMTSLMQPQSQQQKAVNIQSANIKIQTNAQLMQQQGPKIVMKPIGQTPNLNPSLTLKTREQSLPDLHKNNRFVQPKSVHRPTIKPLVNPFATQQHLPIKKAFDTAPAVLISSTPTLSIKSASINDFYYTKEFQDLLKEFKIKVEIKKLPEINDVMAILGTENAEETLKSIRDVARTKEGMELIKGYLDQNTDREDDEFYNYDEDVGTGEIQVEGTEDHSYVQNYQAPNPQYGVPQHQIPSQFPSGPETPFYPTNNNPIPLRPSTTGTLTGTNNSSWWRPGTWFSSSPSTKVESLKKDVAILKNVVKVPKQSSLIEYIGNFLAPSVKEPTQITPSFQMASPRLFIKKTPLKLNFAQSTIGEDTKYSPTVQMTEEQFQDMIKNLRLTPMSSPDNQKAPQTSWPNKTPEMKWPNQAFEPKAPETSWPNQAPEMKWPNQAFEPKAPETSWPNQAPEMKWPNQGFQPKAPETSWPNQAPEMKWPNQSPIDERPQQQTFTQISQQVVTSPGQQSISHISQQQTIAGNTQQAIAVVETQQAVEPPTFFTQPLPSSNKPVKSHEILLAASHDTNHRPLSDSSRFNSPINVQAPSSGIGIPLPSTLTQFDENRRNFISISQPQRATPYDFIATGRVHQANPDEVSKKSRSLAEAVEEEKAVVASISDLTEQHQKQQETN